MGSGFSKKTPKHRIILTKPADEGAQDTWKRYTIDGNDSAPADNIENKQSDVASLPWTTDQDETTEKTDADLEEEKLIAEILATVAEENAENFPPVKSAQCTDHAVSTKPKSTDLTKITPKKAKSSDFTIAEVTAKKIDTKSGLLRNVALVDDIEDEMSTITTPASSANYNNIESTFGKHRENITDSDRKFTPEEDKLSIAEGGFEPITPINSSDDVKNSGNTSVFGKRDTVIHEDNAVEENSSTPHLEKRGQAKYFAYSPAGFRTVKKKDIFDDGVEVFLTPPVEYPTVERYIVPTLSLSDTPMTPKSKKKSHKAKKKKKETKNGDEKELTSVSQQDFNLDDYKNMSVKCRRRKEVKDSVKKKLEDFMATEMKYAERNRDRSLYFKEMRDKMKEQKEERLRKIFEDDDF